MPTVYYGQPEADPEFPIVRIYQSTGDFRDVCLDQAKTTVGSAEGVHLPLMHASIQASHLQLDRVKGGVAIRARGPVKLGSEELPRWDPIPWPPSEALRVGPFVLRLTLPDGTEVTPPSPPQPTDAAADAGQPNMPQRIELTLSSREITHLLDEAQRLLPVKIKLFNPWENIDSLRLKMRQDNESPLNAGWLLEGFDIPLPSGQYNEFTLDITIPAGKSHYVQAGTYIFWICIEDVLQRPMSDPVRLVIHLQRAIELRMKVIPTGSPPRGILGSLSPVISRAYIVEVINAGLHSTYIHFTTSADPRDEFESFHWHPDHMHVKQNGSCKLYVQARRRRLRGRSPRSFVVTASPAHPNAPEVTVQVPFEEDL